MLNIIYTGNWISNHQAVYFKPFNISAQQYNILRILKGAGEPMRVQDIKDRMLERSPNATRLMDKLCAKALIERISCQEDRRVVFVAITPQGLKLVDKISKTMRHDYLQTLSEAEAETLNHLLDKLRG